MVRGNVIFVTNNTKDTVLLDSKTETDSVYAQDKNKVKFEAMLYENKDEELEIEPWSEKQIKIKFSNSYREGNNMKSITFSDVSFFSKKVFVPSPQPTSNILFAFFTILAGSIPFNPKPVCISLLSNIAYLLNSSAYSIQDSYSSKIKNLSNYYHNIRTILIY